MKSESYSPHLRTRDCVGPNLGKSSRIDGSTGIWPGKCTCDISKQGDNNEPGLPHSIRRSGGMGRSGVYLARVHIFIMKWRCKYIYAYGHEARCMVQDQSFGLN